MPMKGQITIGTDPGAEGALTVEDRIDDARAGSDGGLATVMAGDRHAPLTVGAALLFGSDRTRVRRLPSSDGNGGVIAKEALGAQSARRLRQERAILQRLAGVDGVPKLTETEAEQSAAAPSSPVDLHRAVASQ
jgi:hypothetical protein